MGIYTDGKFVVEINHEDLTDLLGGDGAGHYHLQSGQYATLVTGIDSIGVLDAGTPSSDYLSNPTIDLANSFGFALDCGSPTSTYTEV
jgi:hypothetical protein